VSGRFPPKVDFESPSSTQAESRGKRGRTVIGPQPVRAFRSADNLPSLRSRARRPTTAPRRCLRGLRKAATLSGANISDRPMIVTTRGQIACYGLMYRFISAIQYLPAAMMSGPGTISQRASMPRLTRRPAIVVSTSPITGKLTTAAATRR